MGVFAFDTHKAVKQLKDAGFNDDQAEAVTTLFWDTRALDLENLATKDDVQALRREMEAHVTQLRSEMEAHTAQLRSEMEANTAQLRTEMEANTAQLRTEMEANTTQLRSEMEANTTQLRSEMETHNAQLRTEIAAVKSDLIRWIVPLMVGQVAVIAALVKVL